MALEIRSARAEDASALESLLAELGYNPTRADLEATLAETLRDPSAAIRLGVANGRVVALATLTFRPRLGLGGVLATIEELVVSESARGGGVGGALLDDAIALARARRARRLELMTNRGRESYARGFYAKRGFVEANSAVLRYAAL